MPSSFTTRKLSAAAISEDNPGADRHRDHQNNADRDGSLCGGIKSYEQGQKDDGRCRGAQVQDGHNVARPGAQRLAALRARVRILAYSRFASWTGDKAAVAHAVILPASRFGAGDSGFSTNTTTRVQPIHALGRLFDSSLMRHLIDWHAD